jgi:phosphatidate phosphatase LPIN
MSPDGLVSSFKREIIDKTPQTFKIASLTEILNLFPKNSHPFYSGFGNRTTDAVSYRSVGIELSKIFIINEHGEVTQLNNSYKKTYNLLNEIVDELFPVHKNLKIATVSDFVKDINISHA